MTDLWTYRDEIKQGKAGFADPVRKLDLDGYSVEAGDASVGKVDRATYDDGESFLVVDTGLPALGKKVLVPAGLVRSVDSVAQALEVELTEKQLENAPEVDEERVDDRSYRTELGRHYETAAS